MTSSFEIRSTPTFRNLRGKFAEASRELLEARRPLMKELAERYVTLAGEEAPGGPGRTVAKQIGYQTFIDGDSIGFRTRLGPIAKYHVFGTGIYGPERRPIVPVRAAALHFFIGGAEFFRRSVRGVRPNKFLGRAYRRWLPGAREGLAKISTNFVRKIAGAK